MPKDRPLVDRTVFALAEHWMHDYDAMNPEALEDATWALAAEVQSAIENYIQDAVECGDLKER